MYSHLWFIYIQRILIQWTTHPKISMNELALAIQFTCVMHVVPYESLGCWNIMSTIHEDTYMQCVVVESRHNMSRRVRARWMWLAWPWLPPYLQTILYIYLVRGFLRWFCCCTYIMYIRLIVVGYFIIIICFDWIFASDSSMCWWSFLPIWRTLNIREFKFRLAFYELIKNLIYYYWNFPYIHTLFMWYVIIYKGM